MDKKIEGAISFNPDNQLMRSSELVMGESSCESDCSSNCDCGTGGTCDSYGYQKIEIARNQK